MPLDPKLLAAYDTAVHNLLSSFAQQSDVDGMAKQIATLAAAIKAAGGTVTTPPVTTPPVTTPPVTGGGTTTPANGNTTVALPSSPFYVVHPDGNDNADGSPGAPLQTAAGAQKRMQDRGVRIALYKGGTYQHRNPLELRDKDAFMVHRRYPGEEPIFECNGMENPFTFSFACNNAQILGLTIQNMRSSAIRFHGGYDGPADSNTAAHNTIRNLSANTGDGAGRSGGIWFDFVATNNTAANNLITDTEGCSISMATGGGQERIIGNKVLYNICKRANNKGAQDMGGIYILDRSHNVNNIVIQGNWVEDAGPVPGAPGARCGNRKGIYIDDEGSNVLIDRNIVIGMMDMALQIHGGNDVTITNNIFDLTQALLLMLYQEDSSLADYGMRNNTMTSNVIFSTVPFTGNVGERGQPGLTTFLRGNTQDQNLAMAKNMYWNTSNQQVPFPNSGNIDVIDPSAVIGNPMLKNPAGKDYSFSDGGAAVKAAINFVPVNIGLMGPQLAAKAA